MLIDPHGKLVPMDLKWPDIHLVSNNILNFRGRMRGFGVGVKMQTVLSNLTVNIRTIDSTLEADMVCEWNMSL